VRIVIDTNVLVSRYLNPGGTPARLFDRWEDGAFEIAVSNAILDEYERALNYPRVREHHGLTTAEVHRSMERLRSFAVVVAPTETLLVVDRDPADNRFLECAVAAHADYVVTGDNDLLSLGAYAGIQILNRAAFLAVLNA
jgi:putative PIN family toxin of toxin-antitoxin system